MTDEQKLKLIFAEAWLRNPSNAYQAALKVTKNDPFAASKICDTLLFDDEVEEFKKLLIEEHGEDHFLPTKCEMVREVYDRARTCVADDSYAKLMKLAADMRGFIEKPGINITNNTQTNNRVMIVPVGKMTDQGTIDVEDWEKTAIEQQQSLTT
jgi:hypothetical protein